MVAQSPSLLLLFSVFRVCTTNMALANANLSSSKHFVTQYSRTQLGFQVGIVFLSVYANFWLRLVKADDTARSRQKQLLPLQHRDVCSESTVAQFNTGARLVAHTCGLHPGRRCGRTEYSDGTHFFTNYAVCKVRCILEHFHDYQGKFELLKQIEFSNLWCDYRPKY